MGSKCQQNYCDVPLSKLVPVGTALCPVQRNTFSQLSTISINPLLQVQYYAVKILEFIHN